jgi:hypothetical protein
VREKPYTVVLFDEVEKAHPRVLDVLLQVMEEGRLTDGQGRLTTFSETVIIMTSNLGAHHMLVPIIGERERELVMAEVRSFLRPEFINRLPVLSLWDAAALAPIIEEAGGVFTDWDGAGGYRVSSAVATNAALARQVRSLLGIPAPTDVADNGASPA